MLPGQFQLSALFRLLKARALGFAPFLQRHDAWARSFLDLMNQAEDSDLELDVE